MVDINNIECQKCISHVTESCLCWISKDFLWEIFPNPLWVWKIIWINTSQSSNISLLMESLGNWCVTEIGQVLLCGISVILNINSVTSLLLISAVRIFEISNRIVTSVFDLIRSEHNYSKSLNTYCHQFLTYLTEWRRFLPCDAMRCTVLVIVILSVRLSVCLSHSCTVSTWFNLRSWFLHHMVATSF